jgi:hypothetical protein
MKVIYQSSTYMLATKYTLICCYNGVEPLSSPELWSMGVLIW